jgi:hypothetical protein
LDNAIVMHANTQRTTSGVSGLRPILLLLCLLTLGGAAQAVGAPPTEPEANSHFAPGSDARPAPSFSSVLQIGQAVLQARPALEPRLIYGRDALLFPALSLEFFTLGEVLVPVERGTMVREKNPGSPASYWRIIPQFGRVWREPGSNDWSHAAFPVMLVNDTENHAHQGLAKFEYRGHAVRALQVQFVQQSSPWLLHPYTVLWGSLPVTTTPGDAVRLAARRDEARTELADRLPARPLAELRAQLPPGTLEGFGGPVLPKWQVALGLVRNGTLYYESALTPYGPYPYPQEMRFGVRSVAKSVGVPLALLHLAELYGPYVLNLNVGDYVHGLHPKWNHIRFIDAANMCSGFGGTGTLKTHPNFLYDGYIDPHYNDWYTAPSMAEKLAHLNADLQPYPWPPGTVLRYRDQDFYLLGLAIDAFVKSVRGPQADAWQMLESEVFAPLGIHQAPTVRTREADGHDGPAWFNAGYYPTLDDLAKIALLYQDAGAHHGQQLLHRGLTLDLLAARDAIDKEGDRAAPRNIPAAGEALAPGMVPGELYRLGFHFSAHVGSRSGKLYYLPTMAGAGENVVVLYPGRIVSILAAKVNDAFAGEKTMSDDAAATLRAVDRLAPF